MNRAEKIELLRLIKEGKFDPDWLNIQYVVEQPDGSITINGKPIQLPLTDNAPDPIIDKYKKFDFTGVSVKALKKLIDESNKIKNHE